jgi:hypothetical protein
MVMARRAIYCVQAYRRGGAGLEKADLRQFPCASEAEEEALRLRSRRAGVVVYTQHGYPEADVWDEPEVLAAHGEGPEE